MNPYFLLDIAIAYLLDLLVGDPYWLPHPVRWIGWLIQHTEQTLRKMIKSSTPVATKQRERLEFLAGGVLALLVVSVSFLVVFFLLWLAKKASPVLFHGLNVYFIYTALAAKCLCVESKKVYAALRASDIPLARKCISMLVGRETDQLTEAEIIRATVETTAENTVDGVISPLLFAMVGSIGGLGAPVVYLFKAASTLDSMVGYKNEKYLFLGRISARLDDVLNYVPARLSGVFIPLAALLCGRSMKKSFAIMKRDRRNHQSPNSAYPEAAVAGALGVRLGGNGIYSGKLVEKPTIGDADKSLEALDIVDTIKLMYASSLLTLLLGGLMWL